MNLLKKLSPKVTPALIVAVIALVLWAITGDDVLRDIGLSALGVGAGGAALPPTRAGGRDVSQADIEAHAGQIARRRH